MNASPQEKKWTPYAVRLLESCAVAGLSASQAATRMNELLKPRVPFTRNQVGAKCAREGIGLQGAQRRSTETRLRGGGVQLATAQDTAPAAPIGVALTDLTPCMCRWPLGDPHDKDFRYCGKPKAARGAYCEAHARKAYLPTPPLRIRDKEVAA